MKTFALFTALTLSTLVAYGADTILCVDQNLQDSGYAATFTQGKVGTDVSLFVPAGETDGLRYSGACKNEEGAIEFSIICRVSVTSNSGYEVRLFSIGGPDLTASVTPWSPAGKGRSVSLHCEN